MMNKMSKLVPGILAVVLVLPVLCARAEDSGSIARFEITRFEIQGNTLLEQKDIEQLLVPFEGKDRDFESVQKAVETLEAAYRAKGYDIVRVVLPEQELNQGVVTLKVIETRIGKISVSGNKFFSDDNIRDSLPTLQTGQTPLMAQISANLKVANENPAKKAVVQLQSSDERGVVNANLQVTDEKPWSAALTADNTGDEITGRNRLTAVYQNANMGGWDHVLTMQYTTSFANPNEVNVYGVGYHIPLYSLKDSLDFYGSYSNVNSGTVTAGVFDVAVSGSGTAYGTRYNHNMLKVGDYDSTLSFGLDYKIFNNDLAIADLPLGNRIAVHPISLSYTGNWAVTGTTANFFFTAVRNITGGDYGSESDFASARTDANANYKLLRYGFSYLHAFSDDWEFHAALNGQLTTDALIQGEQFGAGGANSVRGFSERNITDDKGRTTNLELYTFNLCSGGALCRVLGFYDSAFVARNDPLPGEIPQESIGSVGLGFRLTSAPDFVLQADVAHVVDASTTTEKGSNRVHFKLVYTF